MKEFIKNISGLKKTGQFLREELERLKLLSAQPMVSRILDIKEPVDNLKKVEFSAFSQWGDDGIIQYLIHLLNIKEETFIEFGVGNYLEANTRFLLMNNHWRGLIFDGSERNMEFVKNDSISWKYDIQAIPLFITRSNINDAIQKAGFTGEIGLLHIDIDGNDYWVWESINVVNPQLVIMEYNSVFGNKEAISTPYADDFYVNAAHYSNLYFGGSLKAMCHLATQKGYSFVGSNSAGNNAYFVRNDKMGPLKALSPEEGYVRCRFRQNRKPDGSLGLIPDNEAIFQAGELPVVQVNTGQTLPLKSCL
ncbi:MAG: hypothetical protein LCH37_00900 [Bacteroidetes bacterium]|nr:hypothetical protein [Bacteroidota bacterium]